MSLTAARTASTRGTAIDSARAAGGYAAARAELAADRTLERAVFAPTIRTSRLTLRPHTMADADAWYAIQSDPEVLRFLPWPERTREQSLTHLRRRTVSTVLARRDDFLALAVERDGTLIGDVSMHLRVVAQEQREVEAGWLLGSAYSGHGYAAEAAGALLAFAFTELRATTASAVIDERNVRSLVLADRLGFLRQRCSHGRWRLQLTHRMLRTGTSAKRA
ncbi:RimJ/RimL family protein N-acetyltransferase [Microterricola gilva]|uniref:RimJ/RimL family protein N-acetyltransferase n=1 Tax=Microterricola gilva TaxID=393267 RepID=A0A4Q8ASB1_9MICO|nr:GNAT family N-acetyltransferase [Microterricola gilva]RZU67035.1 RimJ/RimL family protein N-acetyltransferase [Microterricola gilva]